MATTPAAASAAPALVASARRVAVTPGPSHFAHIVANEMFSATSRFGAVVSVTVESQPCSSVMLPCQPYRTAGRSSPAAITAVALATDDGPAAMNSHGIVMSAYGLTNTAAPASAP